MSQSLLCPDAFLSPLEIDDAVTRALAEDLGRAEQAADIGTGHAVRVAAQLVEHGAIVIERFRQVLGEVAERDAVAQSARPAAEILDAGEQANHGGFAGAVGTHQRDSRAAFYFQIESVINRQFPVTLDRAFQFGHAARFAITQWL